MRTILFVAATAALLLAGCVTRDTSESTGNATNGPTSPVTNAPNTPLGGSGTGCTSNASVGAGNGDITSDHACNATNATNGSI